MTLTFLDPFGLDSGSLTIAPQRDPGLDPLLAEAFLLARAAAQDDTPGVANEGTVGAALDLTADGAEPKVIGPYSWTGEALVGRALLDGGYDDGLSWPTDVHTRWTAQFLPHHPYAGSDTYSEIANINTGDSDRDYLEDAFVIDGDDVVVAQDMDSAGPNNPFSGVGAVAVGTVAGGVDEGDFENVVDADAGGSTHSYTIVRDDETVEAQTGLSGTLTLPEPDDEDEVAVGPFQHSTIVKSWELLDGIDGSPLIAFDASSPTGWTMASGGVTGPPPRVALLGGAGGGWQGDDAALDIGAEDSVTFMFWGRYLGGDLAFIARNTENFGAEPAWSLFYLAGFGGFGFGISDATPANFALGSVGTLDPGDEVLFVAVIDRAEDELRVYLDGSQVGAATDISGIGAVSPDAPIVLAVNECFVYAAAIWDRVLTDTEITVDLPAALGV